MALNGISTLATKELRQVAKLDLAAAKRASVSEPYYRSNNDYDITRLPTQYIDDKVIDNPGSLQEARPWIPGV